MIAIVDYGMGNLRSVSKALEYLGAEARVTRAPEELRASDRIVLPGVGAFGQCVENLRKTGLVELLREEVFGKKKPFLGICVGMQMLAEKGFELGEHQGLGWIPGEVRKLEVPDSSFKLPHVGWNDITEKGSHPLLKGLRSRTFYFTHSYTFVVKDPANVAATCSHGRDFVAAVSQANVFATQFHPEKSQENGIKVLENFLEWAPAAVAC